MDMLALIAVLVGIAFVFTRLVCRRPVGQSRRPSFLLAIAGAFCTALVMVFIFYGGDLFTRRFWDDGKAPMVILVPVLFGICLVVSLIPALLIVRHYRKRFRDENHPALATVETIVALGLVLIVGPALAAQNSHDYAA